MIQSHFREDGNGEAKRDKESQDAQDVKKRHRPQTCALSMALSLTGRDLGTLTVTRRRRLTGSATPTAHRFGDADGGRTPAGAREIYPLLTPVHAHTCPAHTLAMLCSEVFSSGGGGGREREQLIHEWPTDCASRRMGFWSRCCSRACAYYPDRAAPPASAATAEGGRWACRRCHGAGCRPVARRAS